MSIPAQIAGAVLRRRVRRRGSRAFSLLELAMVIAIMGVLAAIAMPRYRFAIERYRVETAAHRLELDLESVRQRARAMGTSLTVTFDTTTGAAGYTVVGMPDPDDPSVWYTVELSQAPYHVDLKAVDFEGKPHVVYNGHGLPTAGGAVTLLAGAHEVTVTVDSVTSHDPTD